jgi:hypothetical protein
VSARARLLGAVAMALTFLGLETMVTVWCGLRPASFTGVAIGAVIGLASLALEIQIVERAMRSAKGDTASATFQTFAMRLALVAPLTFAFQMGGSGVDATAFAVSYLVTFFVYLCWLTWKTYHAPVQYRGKPKQFAPRIVENRRAAATSGSAR